MTLEKLILIGLSNFAMFKVGEYYAKMKMERFAEMINDSAAEAMSNFADALVNHKIATHEQMKIIFKELEQAALRNLLVTAKKQGLRRFFP